MFAADHLTLRLIRLVGEEKWEPHDTGFYFLFVRGGIGEFAIGSVSYQFAQGDVLVLNGAGGGKIGTAGNGELVFSSVSVLVEHLFPLFAANEISLLQDLVGSLGRMKFHAAGSPLAVECHRLIEAAPPQFNMDHRVHLLQVIAVIFREEFILLQRGRPGFMSLEEHLIQVFEKLSANDLLSLHTEELSVKFGCSRRHLSRLFHQHFGFSVAAFRMELRMLRAISLLRDRNAKVNYVAEQCGFNHLGLFTKCFKRRFGTTPGRWRVQGMKHPAAPAIEAGNHSEGLLQLNDSPMFGLLKSAKPVGAPAIQLKNASRLRSVRIADRLERILANAIPSPASRSAPVDSVGSPRLNAFT
jgi:AraC family mar-sox-rob regulon transcriptional activator